MEIDYIIKSATEVRRQMNLSNGVVDFHNLIIFFEDLHAVLIPVIWGKKQNHENAIHIYLPESKTTWIYLNLDTKIFDFKFWMAHELGHVKAPELETEIAEDFADAFAAELLFPLNIAESKYKILKKEAKQNIIVSKIQRLAEEYVISPITIYKQLNNYAEITNNRSFELNMYPSTTNFNKQYKSVTEILFGTESPTPLNYIRVSEETFNTCIFKMIKQYLIHENKGPGFIQRMFNTSSIDSREIYKALLENDKKNHT